VVAPVVPAQLVQQVVTEKLEELHLPVVENVMPVVVVARVALVDSMEILS
jgi:hypothetical protein